MLLLLDVTTTSACNQNQTANTKDAHTTMKAKFLSEPLIKEIYTADPSAHVFDGKIYIYPSHDIEGGTLENEIRIKTGAYGVSKFNLRKTIKRPQRHYK